jgi:hypothetical protein
MGLEGEAGELEAEGGRLGLDAVGAAHAGGFGVLAGAFGQRGRVGPSPRDQDLSRAPKLKGERGVEHVRGSQPEVDPAPRVARR